MRVIHVVVRRPAAAVLVALLAPALAAGKPAKASGSGASKGGAYAQLGEQRAPLFDPAFAGTPIADVGGDAIYLADLVEVLAATHEQHGAAPGGKKEFAPVLDRLIAAKLVAREAREMGMTELPEVAGPLKEFQESYLREAVKRIATRDVKPDPKEVERLYRDQIREWRLRSVLFAGEDAAKRMRAEIEGGRDFAALADRAVADKAAKQNDASAFLAADALTKPVVEAVAKLAPGGVTLPVKVPEGWAVIRVEELRYPDNADARAWAENASREKRKTEALHRYFEKLVKRYGRADRALLAKLDFDAAGAKNDGFAALRKDRRPLLVVRGEQPLTVADLTVEIEKKFYHGAERAAGEKRVDKEKAEVFEAVAFRRLLAAEARRMKLDATPEYRRSVTEQEEALLFGTFVQRAVVPEVKVEEREAQAHYEAHQAEYGYPQFYKLDGVAFREAAQAQAALEKLKAGTDLGWLRQNAPGQLPETDRAVPLGTTVSATSMPEGMAKALAGAHAGDLRLYAAADGAYVLQVVSDTPPKAQPYAEVREAIVRKLYAQRLEAKVNALVAKLRAATPVKVYITGLAG
jgi:parvulin-like peptidyl-prolyl isomerase